MDGRLQDEQQLIERAKARDEEAFADLFRLHYSFLYKYILKMTFDPHIAEDILQDTLLKGFMAMERYDGRSKWTSWMMTIATRIYLDRLRKEKREKVYLHKEKREKRSVFQWQLQQSNLEYNDIMESIQALEPSIRIPLLLKHYYGFNYSEIGEMLQMKEGTVKSRVHKAIMCIRKEMDEFGEGNGRTRRKSNEGIR
ncbi:RNA polymerase sigma factor SigY [Bacillus sp. 1P06AnD]|uniref:RNA polymerase sigma factor SigY n=1 Tax=Bacillus sp. 1P06AnD TaxID=3132208 RepID=UPI0039A1641B